MLILNGLYVFSKGIYRSEGKKRHLNHLPNPYNEQSSFCCTFISSSLYPLSYPGCFCTFFCCSLQVGLSAPAAAPWLQGGTQKCVWEHASAAADSTSPLKAISVVTFPSARLHSLQPAIGAVWAAIATCTQAGVGQHWHVVAWMEK